MIFTFYSYKGGVGRSMALANVAEIFYQAGLKVLIIDWDLEAPGLESYFFVEDIDNALNRPGLIDLLLDYKKRMSNQLPTNETLDLGNVTDSLIEVYQDKSESGKLFLLTAGRRGSNFREYAKAVLTFDWQDFYDNWEGELYFDWLREQFEEIADVVLIDSRTGVTEMSGICTYQLADAIVMFCVLNNQNLEGTRQMLLSFSGSEVKELRPDRPLTFLMVPSRVEDRSELRLLNSFRRRFIKLFDKYFPHELVTDINTFWDLRIPHLPLLAFGETVAAREYRLSPSEDVSKAFKNLALMIGQISSLSHTAMSIIEGSRGASKIRSQNLLDFTVQIRDNSGRIVGSGIIVSEDGKIVTCTHVVKQASTDLNVNEIVIIYFQDTSHQTRLVSYSPIEELDVALLKIDDPMISFGKDQVAVLGAIEESAFGEFISFGYPSTYDSGLYATGRILGQTTEGKIQLESDQITVGMSGSAILDTERNLVIGIVSALTRPDRVGRLSSTAFAVTSNTLAKMFEELTLRDIPYVPRS